MTNGQIVANMLQGIDEAADPRLGYVIIQAQTAGDLAAYIHQLEERLERALAKAEALEHTIGPRQPMPSRPPKGGGEP